MSTEIGSRFQSHDEPITPSKLLDLLKSAVRHFSDTFIIIDALDEYSKSGTGDEFFKGLEELLDSDIHLLITSRHNLMTEHIFQNKASRIEIDLRDITAIQKDIVQYLHYRIRESPRLNRYVEPDLQNKIIETITKEADGVFLVASLHMDSLATMTTTRDILRELRNLPKQLYNVYDDAMKRIRRQDEDEAELAVQVLYWLSFVFSRPLAVAEIRDVLATEPGQNRLDGNGRPHMDLVVSICGGLVTVDGGTDERTKNVRLANYPTWICVKRILIERFPDALTRMAKICLTYISFDEFAGGPCSTDEKLESRLSTYPFLQYAAQHWGDFARGEPEEKVEELAVSFLQDDGKLMSANQVIRLPEERHPGDSQDFPKDAVGLEIAASFGLERIVRLLLNKGRDDAKEAKALRSAAENGRENVAKLLLENGAKIESTDANGRTALLLAANSGYLAVVKLLLDASAKVEAKDKEGRTPMLLAARNGHEDVVQLLLQKMVSDKGKDREGTQALIQEIKKEQEAVKPDIEENRWATSAELDEDGYPKVQLKGGVSCVRGNKLDAEGSFTPGPYVVVGWFPRYWHVPIETLVPLVEVESNEERKIAVIDWMKINKYDPVGGLKYLGQQYYVQRVSASAGVEWETKGVRKCERKKVHVVFKPIQNHKVFAKIRKAVGRVRGWREWLSLKGLKGFGLYKCTTMNNEHLRDALLSHLSDAKETARMIKNFMEDYASVSSMELEVQNKLGSYWSKWIDKNLNDKMFEDGQHVRKGEYYSIELIYVWSTFRITTLISVSLIAIRWGIALMRVV